MILRTFTQLIEGIHLTGKLNGWATPKDLILHIAGRLTVRVSLVFCSSLYPAIII
jgi:hypothetical protein